MDASSTQDVEVLSTERLRPSSTPPKERSFPLSLIDATVANFALTSAFWCFATPSEYRKDASGLVNHLRKSLRIVLGTYPHWTGHLRTIETTDGSVPPEVQDFAPHACRFGRVYVHFGTSDDPGVDFALATSTRSLDDLYPHSRPELTPLWDRNYTTDPFVKFLPSAPIRNPTQPYAKGETGSDPATLAIQLTQLACGGFIISASLTHSLGDITALIQFFKDWASVSRALLEGKEPPISAAVVDPSKLDAAAAGDINHPEPDQNILDLVKALPLARFDWWAPSTDSPWPRSPPKVFEGQELTPAGDVMPWKDWDTTAPVLNYTIHLTRQQVDFLWAQVNILDEEADNKANGSEPASQRISRHDAVLAHIWTCVTRARNFTAADDDELVHCYPTLGLRPVLNLGASFIGSPILMLNLKLPVSTLLNTSPSSMSATKTSTSSLRSVAQYIRAILSSVNDNNTGLAAHLHGLAYEKSPQRIWNGFLGRRHTIVTTWARAGVYDIDFGLHRDVAADVPFLRYADGIVPRMDGCIMIKEGPPPRGKNASSSSSQRGAWTDNGVDVAVAMNSVDMERFLADTALLPRV